MRIIRARADEFNIDANKIGVMGFSAGGYFAALLSTAFDKNVYDKKMILTNYRQDLIFAYAVIQ